MIRLRLLGETAIDVDDVAVGPESQVLFALLLVLALERGRRLARPALHQLLWPTADEDSGRHNLRQVLYKLRQLGVPVDATQSSVMLRPSDVCGEIVDLTTGGPAIGTRLADGRRVGELLPGYVPAFSSPFADWVDEQRALLQAQLRRSLLTAMADARALGHWREVEAIAREVLRFDALNEEATLALAEATALVGAKAQALGIIDRYLDEVGGHPGDLRLPATVLRRRIAERFPTHRYVSAADACFVGRADEMATVLGLWHRARDRRGGAVLLWGEPGIGKTRLAHELGRVATLQGAQVQRVASRSWDVQRPLGAIVDLVPPLRELPGAAGVDPRCNEYLDRLTKHDPDRPLTDLPDPATLHRQVRQAVFDLVDALLEESPLVLVFEDVQWLDASSWEMLAELLRLSRTRRLLLVLTSRVAQPAQMPESEDWEALRRLRLDGIDAGATSELLDAMTREAGKYIDPDYREWCVPLANGNPLHVQEIALQWLEKGSVREAPGSLRAMIEARIGRISPSAGMLIRVSALLASPADADLCIRTGLLSQRDFVDAVEELTRTRLCTVSNGCVTSSHPVVAEVVVRQMDQAHQHVLHRLIASALENVAIETSNARLVWEAARQWERAGAGQTRIRALLRCADHLFQVGMPRDALSLLELASPLADSVEERAAVRSAKALALAHDDKWADVARLLKDERPSAALSPSSLSGPAMLRQMEARWHQHEDVTPIICDAVTVVQSCSYDSITRIRAATLALMLTDNRDGSLQEFSRCSEQVEVLLRDATVPAHERHRLSMIRHACEGRAYECGLAARDLLRTYDLTLRPFDGMAHRQAAYALRLAGETEEADIVLRQALELGSGDAHGVAQQQTYLSLAINALHLGNVESARRWCKQVADEPSVLQSDMSRHYLNFALTQIAAAANDRAQLLSTSRLLGAPEDHNGNVRRRLGCLSAIVRARVELMEAFTSRECAQLSSFLELLGLHQHRGNMDFVVSACCRALVFQHRGEEADAILHDYLSIHRLEQGSLHADLRNLVSQRSLVSV